MINGVDISIDVQTDSPRTILDRINTSQQAVTAAYCDQPQRVTFTANAQGQAIGLDAHELNRDLRHSPRATLAFLVGTESSAGYLDTLAVNIDRAIAQIGSQLGPRGTMIDRFA